MNNENLSHDNSTSTLFVMQEEKQQQQKRRWRQQYIRGIGECGGGLCVCGWVRVSVCIGGVSNQGGQIIVQGAILLFGA